MSEQKRNKEVKEKEIRLSIDEKLHRKFKTACYNKGLTMRQVFIQGIEDFVAKTPK